jgi:ribosome biogenesis GTPase / thiamine phosphate phosphatase
MDLKRYGLTPEVEREASLHEGMHLGRVSEQHREQYAVVTEHGELRAAVSGRFAYHASGSAEFPAVGDWVLLDRTEDSAGNAVIHQVLTRRSVFRRKGAGTAHTTQIVAANIDVVFLCMSLNADFNLRRLERYLSIAWDSGATPVIVLTKADLCDDLSARLEELSTVSVGSDVVVCSCIGDGGYRDVMPYLAQGRTIAFIGSSGVGKSTLINRLMGRDVLATREIDENDRGRHATTSRQLLLLPHGGVVIDTPGMRELQLESADIGRTFEDIEALAEGCRYRDCTHVSEPGCAVRGALADGTLSEDRVASYRKLMREVGYEGLNSRQLEQEKIKRMFGGLGEMKQAMREVKKKNR